MTRAEYDALPEYTGSRVLDTAKPGDRFKSSKQRQGNKRAVIVVDDRDGDPSTPFDKTLKLEWVEV